MPEKIGSYTVVAQLGRGGMGIVYKGRDESLNRFVAIKVLTENLSSDPTFLQRFVREAQAAASLSHPNIIQIYFTGQDEAGHPYFVMEYVDGQSLEQLLRSEGRIDNPRASQLMLQASHGLAAAHDRGIVHRDIKPANLILDDRGILKIADFGLALPPDAETQLTATGMMVGTPGYLSPEQFDGAKADALTDIYALGITYYMLLTGTPPFRGESPLAMMKQIVDANPPDVTTVNPNVDPESRRILAKMIAKDRTQRYQNSHELVADLENLVASMGVRNATSGLARTPAAALPPEQLAAMAAPTLITARDATQPKMAANQTMSSAAVTSPGIPIAGAVTSPGIPVGGPPTNPAIAVQVPPKKRSSAPVLMIVLFAFVLVAGGGVGAVWYGRNLLRAKLAGFTKVDTKQTAAATSNGPSNAPSNGQSNPPSTPQQGVLLSQTMTPSALASDSAVLGTPAGVSSAPAQNPDAQTKAAQPVGQTARSEPIAQMAAQSNAPAAARSNASQPATKSDARAAVTPAPAHRTLKGVAVASIGDRSLLGTVSSVLRSEANDAGLEAVDAHGLPSTEQMLDGRPAVRDLIARLRDDGYAVLMLAKIEATGERELSYMGRSDTAYTARVTVTAYDLATGRPIGNSESGEIEYTSINIKSKSEKVVAPLAQSCAEMIRNR